MLSQTLTVNYAKDDGLAASFTHRTPLYNLGMMLLMGCFV